MQKKLTAAEALFTFVIKVSPNDTVLNISLRYLVCPMNSISFYKISKNYFRCSEVFGITSSVVIENHGGLAFMTLN